MATAGDEIVAVARFDRLGDPSEAEVAFVVADSWQELGLGTVLFRRLAGRAVSRGESAGRGGPASQPQDARCLPPLGAARALRVP